MNTIKINKKPTVTPDTGMKVTGLDKEGKVVNFDYDDLEKQRDAYRGPVADTDPVPANLRNGDYVRCKGDSATIYTFTNFGGVQAKGGWRLEYSLETNSWTPINDTGSGDIALTSDMDAAGKKIVNLGDAVDSTDGINYAMSINTSHNILKPNMKGASALNLLDFHDFIRGIHLIGADPTKEYYIGYIKRNNGSTWWIRIYEVGGSEVARFITYSSPEVAGTLTKHYIPTYNSSGITGTIVVNWEAIPDGSDLRLGTSYIFHPDVFKDNTSQFIDSFMVDMNTADIATNTADIATNTADIATNTADIATNTAGIIKKTDVGESEAIVDKQFGLKEDITFYDGTGIKTLTSSFLTYSIFFAFQGNDKELVKVSTNINSVGNNIANGNYNAWAEIWEVTLDAGGSIITKTLIRESRVELKVGKVEAYFFTSGLQAPLTLDSTKKYIIGFYNRGGTTDDDKFTEMRSYPNGEITERGYVSSWLYAYYITTDFSLLSSGDVRGSVELSFGTINAYSGDDFIKKEVSGVSTFLSKNFLKGSNAEFKQVYKLALFGDSIMRSGFGEDANTVWTGDYLPDGAYPHLLRYIEEYVFVHSNLFDAPVKRNARHSDWTLTGATLVGSNYPYGDNIDSMNWICLLDDDAESAEIANVTGKETFVLIFEGGSTLDGAYTTGIATINVSIAGSAYQSPSAAGLKGELTKYGFGNNKVYEAPYDEFDTAFTYPADAYSPETGGGGTAPVREIIYNNLDPAKTYKFRIKRKAGNTLPVRLFGAYYFTGKTFRILNAADPGKSWDALRKRIYNTLVLPGVDYVMTQAPIFHDFYDEDTIKQYIEDFSNELLKWGIDNTLMSCSPGGVVSQGSKVTILGDQEPANPANTNLSKNFNHQQAFNISPPAYADYPDLGCVYELTIGATTYQVTGTIKKPNEADYGSWVYNDVFWFFVNDEDLYQTLRFNEVTYPITLTKISGDGAATLTASSKLWIPPRFEYHRNLIVDVAKKLHIGFIDVYENFVRVANAVGETIETDPYTMNENHPLWSGIDSAFRHYRVTLPIGSSVPTVGAIYSLSVDGTTRYFNVSVTGSVNLDGTDYEYVEFEAIDYNSVSAIYLGEASNLSIFWNGASYTLVSGTGDSPLTGFTGIYNYYLGTHPIKMNYMSNFFDVGDGHHLAYNAHKLYFEIIRDGALNNSLLI